MKCLDWEIIKRKSKKEQWAMTQVGTMRKNTREFMENYRDDPAAIAGWGHNFHCDQCGGRLVFDLKSPHAHACGVCGTVNTGPKKDNAWTASYRSTAFSHIFHAGILHNLEPDQAYIGYISDVLDFFSRHFHAFEAEAPAKRFQGKLTGINLTDAVGVMSAIMGMSLVREHFTQAQLDRWEKELFLPLSEMFDQFSNKIYNIPVWMKAAEGMTGVFFGNRELLDRAFKQRFGILDQLERGVTKDGMWYECSTHYHFYTLDPLLQLLFLCREQEVFFPELETMACHVHRLLTYPLKNIFSNGMFPNPSDGWPDMHIGKYAKQLEYGAFLFDDPHVRKACAYAGRTAVPGVEKLLFNPGYADEGLTDFGSCNFEDSFNAILKNGVSEVYLKTGVKTICHAHPDVMNIELCFYGDLLSYDLGSNGYSTQIFGEWQRKSISHNTVVLNTMDQRYEPVGEGIWPEGIVEHFDPCRIRAKSKNVYECVDYVRDIMLEDNRVHDAFTVKGIEEYVIDWVFYCEGEVSIDCPVEHVESIGDKEGYQHLKDIRGFDGSSDWRIAFEKPDKTLTLSMKGVPGTSVYVVNSYTRTFQDTRYGVIVRRRGMETVYEAVYECRKKEDPQ
ncbi:MAG: heparinase II/III family protein [Clostridia bacterium]